MIKTIIFDWGGVFTIGKYTQSVLETLSKEKTISIDEIYLDFDNLVVRMNDGSLSFEDFVKEAGISLNIEITVEEMKDVFKKSIVPNDNLIKLVEVLKLKYNLVMLSNNDEVTVNNLKESYPEMLVPFSRQYFSHDFKMRKPNVKFFEYVLSDAGLDPSQCIFIDDKQKNVDVANQLGMKGIKFSSVEQLKKDLKIFSVDVD